MSKVYEFSADGILAALRDMAESDYGTDERGSWGGVYLDNVRLGTHAGMSAHQFAGFLSALKERGQYRVVDGEAWGEVLMPAGHSWGRG